MINRLVMIILVATLSIGVMAVNPISKTMSTSTQEQYSYRYIVELYDSGDNESILTEIYQFKSLYPSSIYLPYINFLDANLSLEAGKLAKAESIYVKLLNDKVSSDILPELLLNYAISLNLSGEYVKAMDVLQQLDSEVSDPLYKGEALIQRADIYSKLGQYYSAERAYKDVIVLQTDNQELQLGLFKCLIQLQKDDEAMSIFWNQDPNSKSYALYIQNWLQYLLVSERYLDFDAFIQSNELGESKQTLDFYDLKIRRALLKNDFMAADSILALTGTPNSHFEYYKAITLIANGKESKADSILQALVRDKDPEIAVSAYLEQLKLLYKTEPLAAITQLANYIKTNQSKVKKAELYYTLGYFCYQKDDFKEAMKQFSLARQFDMSTELNSKIDILLAESWFALGRTDMANEAFNKYLNVYPEGSVRDKAYFYIGYIEYQNKDYPKAKSAFNTISRILPSSKYIGDALFYLGEIDFYLANYNLALENYKKLLPLRPSDPAVSLRISQSYYYLGDYNNCEQYLDLLQPNYESCILKGNLLISKKDYPSALEQFIVAESFAVEPLRKTEAQSYRALCLYQMKRYKEASALYLLLSNTEESPDTYLYLSAKSAYSAKDYNQALQIFDTFIQLYPSSTHYLSALSTIANAYYNMGNYPQAHRDWINILIRFRNNSSFNDAEFIIVKDALMGIELSINRIDTQELSDKLIELPDTFSSEFIKFELNLMLLKTFAAGNRWDDLVAAAERVRTEYPQRYSDEIALMMATGLINLHHYESADSLLSSIYNNSKSIDTLLKWAELEKLTGNYDSALEKYKQAFEISPTTDTWLNMLDCSSELEYSQFEQLWALGSKLGDEQTAASRYRLHQLYHDQRYVEALILAESLLDNSLSTNDHAEAFLVMGLIDYQKQDYSNCISAFKRVILLFPEFPDIRKRAIYYVIKAEIESGAITEAEMHSIQYSKELDENILAELNQLLESNR
ncbi:MAG: tetratricopeptide repeat protein [Candidatus Cloacimonetes bacterium]|nr:tetratricopeptide repeat protein [Candidatus Cloacimonadota bacterium]